MTTWFTADLHFGHANIISYSGRPFADAAAMNQALIERRNDSILPDEPSGRWVTLRSDAWNKTLAFVRELNGRKAAARGQPRQAGFAKFPDSPLQSQINPTPQGPGQAVELS